MKKTLLTLALIVLGPVLKSYMALLRATCTVNVIGQAPKGPAIYAIWHGRLAYMPLLAPAGMPTTILSSASKDGRLGASVARALGFENATGSSSKKGALGARQLLQSLKKGGNIFLTPDGPKGPAQLAKPGATALAELSGLPVIPCAGHASYAKTFASWDTLQLPLPFSTLTIMYGKPLAQVSPESLTSSLNMLHAYVAQAKR
jgi:lysophospholipid acyltransferase (LPLAT)-like uncharacterized protein